MKRWRMAFRRQVLPDNYVKPTKDDRELLERFIAQNVNFTNPKLEEIQRLKSGAEKHILYYSLGTVHKVYIYLQKHGKTQLGFRPRTLPRTQTTPWNHSGAQA